MTADGNWVVSLIIAFLPFIILFMAMHWHARQIQKSMTTKDGRSLADVMDEFVRELKRTNDLGRSPAP
jgi:uncharacterized membrane protein